MLLPNGTVYLLGGHKYGLDNWPPDGGVHRLVFSTELYDPATATNPRKLMAPMWHATANLDASDGAGQVNNIPHGTHIYHSTALLLPDGCVLAAGTEKGYGQNPIPAVYYPPYNFEQRLVCCYFKDLGNGE